MSKGPNSDQCLESNHFIHNKGEECKFFSHIVISQAKEILNKNMSIYQIATKPGHRATEHLFLLKSVLALNELKKEVIIFSAWDLKAFFDSEYLEDVMRELYKKEIRGKVYRLIFRMNENIVIKVKTPVGVTDAVNTGMGIGQGSVDAATISSASIDGGVTEHFADAPDIITKTGQDSNKNVLLRFFSPGKVFHPCIFQDDIGKISADIDSAQEANKRIEEVVEKKLLTLNLKKSTYTVIGNKAKEKKMLMDIQERPLKLSGQEMKYSKSLKYLGEWLKSTCSESVQETVNKRVGIVTKSIFEIRSIVDDSRSNAIGGLSLAFLR